MWYIDYLSPGCQSPSCKRSLKLLHVSFCLGLARSKIFYMGQSNNLMNSPVMVCITVLKNLHFIPNFFTFSGYLKIGQYRMTKRKLTCVCPSKIKSQKLQNVGVQRNTHQKNYLKFGESSVFFSFQSFMCYLNTPITQ